MSMKSRRNALKKHPKPDMDEVAKICAQFDVSLDVTDIYFTMTFKDGKVLFYAMPINKTPMLPYILSGIHGRVFRKDGDFIGYAPQANSLESILLAVDMMI